MWRAISFTLGIFFHLVEIAVVLAMFHVAKSSFETIVVSGLVLTYLSVVGSFAMLGHALLEKGHQDFARFIELAKALRLDAQIYEEALQENREEFQKGKASFWIGVAFKMLLALIAAAYLVNVLWLQA